MAVFRVLVSPGKATNRVTGFEPWRKAWTVEVAAPPARGEATRQLLRFLARVLGVPPQDLRLVHGGKARLKTLAVDLGEEDLARRLRAAARRG